MGTKQKEQQKEESIRLVMVSIGVGVVAKTDDEICVLSTIKICSCF